MKSKINKYRAGIVEGWVSGLGNIVLFGLKLWAGIMSGSIALIADAWHSLSDTLSSILIILGFRFASKPADKQHPFGHGRVEMVVSLIIGILLILVGFHFIAESIERLNNSKSADFGILAIVVTVFSVIFKEAMAQYAFYVARITGSESVKGDGWHHRSDAFTSLVILAGILLKDVAWWIDGLMGILVALVIFYFAFEILKKTINNLLGKEPEPEQIAEISKIATEIYDGDLKLHHFHIHNYGFHNEMTFHIVLPGDLKLSEATKITRQLFVEIKSRMNIMATIHIDTQSKY